MLKNSPVLTAAISLGTFCTANAAGSAATDFAKTEISQVSGTSCAVRIPPATNRLIRLKGLSCVDLAGTVTRADLRIVATSNLAMDFEGRVIVNDMARAGLDWAYLLAYPFHVIDTEAHALWINLEGTVAGETAATCYAAFQRLDVSQGFPVRGDWLRRSGAMMADVDMASFLPIEHGIGRPLRPDG